MSALKQTVIDIHGKDVGSINLDPAIFGAEIDPSLVHTTVVWQRNKKRAGTHSSLTKAEVSGGGKKPWKQKGTGQARAGSNTSPLWVGGGVSHGPKPRDYTTRVSKRTRRQALCSVLSDKVKNGNLKVLESLELGSGKTKDAVKVLKGLKVEGVKIAILVAKASEEKASKSKKATKEKVSACVSICRAVRNIPGVTLLSVDAVNVYDLLAHKVLLGTKDSITELQERLKKA